jgi:hypothetical protein
MAPLDERRLNNRFKGNAPGYPLGNTAISHERLIGRAWGDRSRPTIPVFTFLFRIDPKESFGKSTLCLGRESPPLFKRWLTRLQINFKNVGGR